MKTILTDYWKLLDHMEDYLRGGIEREHPEPPELSYTVERTLDPEPAAPAEPPRFHGASTSGVTMPSAPDSLEAVAAEVGGCTLCGLGSRRINSVPGEGVENPLVMVIGEGPGAEEDRTGKPFVGPAGQYLDKWLASIDLDRSVNCFICNIVKCRPPMNRDPLPEESSACIPYLNRQIAMLRPKAILSVGRIASQLLIGSTDGIGRLRGNTYAYKGIPLVPTYHPSGVLRNPEHRPRVWEDLKRLKAVLERD